jgi:hypothetical protein
VIYGGDSGNRIFVLYWRCSLIRVSVIRGSTVYCKYVFIQAAVFCNITPCNFNRRKPILLPFPVIISMAVLYVLYRALW